MKSPFFVVAFTILSASALGQIVPGSSGNGVPTFNCAVNDTYKDNTYNGSIWQCGPTPNTWHPLPAAVPWVTPVNNDCLTGNGATWVAAACMGGGGSYLPLTGGTLTGPLTIAPSGGVGGYWSFGQGTFPSSFPLNSVSMVAPTSIPTAYAITLPSAPPTANGQVLSATTGGVGSWVANGGGGSGGLTLLAAVSVTAATELDMITRNATGQSGALFNTDFDVYQCTLNIGAVTTGIIPQLQFSTNGGSTWLATNYATNINATLIGTSNAFTSGTSNAGGIGMTNFSGINNGFPPALATTFTIYDPVNAADYSIYVTGSSAFSTSTGTFQGIYGAYHNASVSRNAMRVYGGGTDVMTGTLRCYGLLE